MVSLSNWVHHVINIFLFTATGNNPSIHLLYNVITKFSEEYKRIHNRNVFLLQEEKTLAFVILPKKGEKRILLFPQNINGQNGSDYRLNNSHPYYPSDEEHLICIKGSKTTSDA